MERDVVVVRAFPMQVESQKKREVHRGREKKDACRQRKGKEHDKDR